MTSTRLVESAIAQFLSTKDPEVLCISGEWGIGKTFAWQTMLDRANDHDQIELKRYSYVSLFGISSLEGLKLSIFENTEFFVPRRTGKTLEKLKKSANRLFKFGKRSKDLAGSLPYLGNVMKSAGPLFFSTVRDQIVCIDDLERRSQNLRVTDVLGLMSFLREQRRCKVVLLLNEDELGREGQEEYRNYFEKVVDSAMKFAPTPEESVRIALPGTDSASEKIRENCKILGISNIRVIKKIERFVTNIEPFIGEFDKRVFHQAVHSLTLLAWSKYQPGTAPSLQSIKTRRGLGQSVPRDGEEITEETAAFNALLDAYGFLSMDEFDFALLAGIDSGSFNGDVIRDEAQKLDRKLGLAEASNSFDEAWRAYHDSFDNNQEEVLDKIYDSFKENVEVITPVNMNGTVALLRDLGREEQATKLIHYYIQRREEPPQFWDMSKQAFGDLVTDADVRRAFNEKLSTFENKIDPLAVLTKMAELNAWYDQELVGLAEAPVDAYYEILKESSGGGLPKLIAAALQFDRIQNATPPMREISGKMKQALVMIGEESPINARRVAKYGIRVNEEEPASRPALPPDGDDA